MKFKKNLGYIYFIWPFFILEDLAVSKLSMAKFGLLITDVMHIFIFFDTHLPLVTYFALKLMHCRQKSLIPFPFKDMMSLELSCHIPFTHEFSILHCVFKVRMFSSIDITEPT